jgi:tRNA 2-thiouridine synthesizing protein A
VKGQSKGCPFLFVRLSFPPLRSGKLPDRISISCFRENWGTESCALSTQEQVIQPDAELDLRGVICPYNFVKTKLKLETMEQGQILSVILDAGDPIRNVPQSVSNEGHTVLSQEPINQSYRVIIRRN